MEIFLLYAGDYINYMNEYVRFAHHKHLKIISETRNLTQKWFISLTV